MLAGFCDLDGRDRDGLTWTVLSPGQAPATKEPEQVLSVFKQMPEPELVLQVLLTQNTAVGP